MRNQTWEAAFLLILALGLTASAQSPSPSPSPTPTPVWSSRVAALKFALANGINKPTGEIVVAEDAYFGAVDGYPAPLSPEDTKREARDMAALLGPDVKVVRAIDYLICQGRAGSGCAPSRNISVFIVGGLWKDNTPGSYVQLYMPGLPETPSSQASLVHGAIDLERIGDGWIATRFRLGPSTVTRRK